MDGSALSIFAVGVIHLADIYSYGRKVRLHMNEKAAVKIQYCTSWGSYLKQVTRVVAELLAQRHSQISELTLVPSTGGVFDVTVKDKLIFSKKASSRFPEEGEIVRLFEESDQWNRKMLSNMYRCLPKAWLSGLWKPQKSGLCYWYRIDTLV